MSTRGCITLGELQGRVTMLEIACSRCDRKGRLRLDRLIEKYGADQGMPDLREIIASDCPRMHTVGIHHRCGVRYPQLPRLFPAE